MYAPKINLIFLRNIGKNCLPLNVISSFLLAIIILFLIYIRITWDLGLIKKGDIPTTYSMSTDEVKIFRENFELTDLRRVLNPDATSFTWRRKKNRISLPFRSFPYKQHPVSNY